MARSAKVIGKRADGGEAWCVDVVPGRRVRTVDMPDGMQHGDVVRVFRKKVAIRFNVTAGPWAGETRVYTVSLDSIRLPIEFDAIEVRIIDCPPHTTAPARTPMGPGLSR